MTALGREPCPRPSRNRPHARLSEVCIGFDPGVFAAGSLDGIIDALVDPVVHVVNV
jgi:hypothetical protein